MLDPEGRSPDERTEGEAAPEPAPTESLPAGDWPALAFWAASRGQPATSEAPAAGWTPEPPPPMWTRTYEVPTARKVVSSGLQLAVASSGPIRRASIYIGLLSLGAFGPAVILLLLGVGRLMSIPGTAETLTTDPTLLFFEQPEIVGPLVFVYVLALLGILLLGTISIDAQAIAIALLAGTASDRPLHLREAIARARQTFWRLAGAGFLVGLASGVIAAIIAIPFIRPLDTNVGITFIASMVGTLVVVPFAFAATGIVLGDVGAMEALRRSVALFRARPRIALVVTLFTLVTSAIQTFAVSAGLDVAIRVAEFLHLGLDQGPIGLILPAVLVLAFIVAFGSLTFTIAAIVAAPQVSGFLGLTFYAGGLDRARAEDGKPARARWVTLPMAGSMVVLAIIAGLGLPAIYGFEPRAASPLLSFLRTSAQTHESFISPFGAPLVVEDPAGDHGTGAADAADILAADMAGLYSTPQWLLQDVFNCAADGVACGDEGGGMPSALGTGALVFMQRVAAAPLDAAGPRHVEWGQLIRLPGYVGAPVIAGDRYEGANFLFSTTLDDGRLKVHQYVYEDGSWTEYFTSARSAWRDDLLLTLVPIDNLADYPTAWDSYAWIEGATPAYDNVRPEDGEVIEIADVPWIDFFSADFGNPFASPTPAP